MRCTRIEFNGYKRLASAATNIDGDITAFVGLNEAGKTTLLRGLVWLTKGGVLAATELNRTRPPSAASDSVVTAFYALSEDDRRALNDIRMDDPPTSMVVMRLANGEQVHQLRPRPKRPAKPFEDAETRLRQTRLRLAKQFESDTDEDGPAHWATLVSEALQRPEQWNGGVTSALQNLAAWLGDVPANPRATKPRDQRLKGLLGALLPLVTASHPADVAIEVLKPRVPAFVPFEDANRVLETTHELSDDQVRSNPPVALRDLLLIADVTLEGLWTHLANGDSTGRETLLEQANERLLTFFAQAWNQSNITVRLNITSTQLEVMVKELRQNGPVTNINERSDGLRTFVALAAFLGSGGWAVPPILVIDEAETHLHYDAQADLVGVLLKTIDATQVFYTTHSPGCLPSDLGTGIRLVARDPDYGDASIIKNNFWLGEEPGFAPLLYAMGAGAAAFSVCRKAVVAEGPSDMILLPTLLRMATKKQDLEYQVAPGLSNAHSYGLRVEEVAAKVVYLADGDAGGDDLLAQLKKDGVDASRMFQLPKGSAVEDLVHQGDFLNAVNDMLAEMAGTHRLTKDDLAPNKTVAKSLTDWGRNVGARIPSKPELAYALLRHKGLRLSPDGRRALKKLHIDFLRALDA